MTRINCSNRCCCPDVHHAGTQPVGAFGISADPSQCLKDVLIAAVSQGSWKGPGGNVLALAITAFSVSVVTVTRRINAESRFLERFPVHSFAFQDTWYLGSSL